MATVTDRQYIALRLWYLEGWSQHQVARAFGITQPAVHALIARGRRWVFEAVSRKGLSNRHLVEGLFGPSMASSLTRDLGAASGRRDELLDELEIRMDQQAREAAAFSDCMLGDSLFSAHPLHNTFDQWEMQYALEHGCEHLPTTAYDAPNAGKYAAME